MTAVTVTDAVRAALAISVAEAERFLRAILPLRTDDERYRLEFFGDDAPKLSATSKNYLDIGKLAEALIRHGQRCDAYVALATFPVGGEDRRAGSARRMAVVWADLDVGLGKPYGTQGEARGALERFQLPPTLVVASGHGLHAYWVLNEPTDDLDRVLAIVRGLVQVLNGDPKVVLKSQVMRVPGTYNHKKTNAQPILVRLVSLEEENVYPIDAFADAGVPEISVPAPAEPRPAAVGDISSLPVGARAWKFIAGMIPIGEQRFEAVAVARSLIGAGHSVDATADYLWKGMQASPNDPANPWTYEDALDIASDIARRPAPPLVERSTASVSRQVRRHEERAQAKVAACAEFPLTDAGNAELFADELGHRVRYDHKRRRALIFDAHHWREDADGEIDRLAIATARRRREMAAGIPDPDKAKTAFRWAITSESKSRLDAMVSIACSLQPIADRGEGWDSNPDVIGVPNGVVDLRTGELRDGRPEDRITLVVPVAYDPEARCTLWPDALLAMMEGDADLVRYIQVAQGYSLTGHTSEQVVFLLHGRGANGKSVFLNTVRTAAGDYGHNLPFTALELSARTAIPADIAQLPDRRLVTSSETSDAAHLNEARIKMLSGGDEVTAAEKFKPPFRFRPRAKLWLATNHLPTVADDSYGFWRRMRVIPFRHQFEGAELDPYLESKLMGELPGILRWMVEGAMAWYGSGLQSPDIVTAATAVYRADSDPLADFLTERCELVEAAVTTAADLYREYLHWANDHNLGKETVSNTRFGRLMGEHFERTRPRVGTAYRGVGIRPRDMVTGFEADFGNLSRANSHEASFQKNPPNPVTVQREAVRHPPNFDTQAAESAELEWEGLGQ